MMRTKRSTSNPIRRHAGRSAFTMIELMIVIAIMAVVMSISIPTFYRSLEHDAIRRATQEVLDACVDARTQAIISGRPCDLVIWPQQLVMKAQLARDLDKTAEELAMEEALKAVEELARQQKEGESGGEKAHQKGTLPEGITIMFIGVNFVPDLQEAEAVPVRFYPNGTGDEFTMLIRSDQNEWRKFTMDVATGVVKFEAMR